MARPVVFWGSGARDRWGRHIAITTGLPRAQQMAATKDAFLMRTAVVGVGYLGRFHAQKYAILENSELVGIADPSATARAAVGVELGVPAHADYRELLGRVDAVSIVTPTPYHFAVAKDFLEAGAHVLVEKPMTVTVEEGVLLIEAARRAKRVLQVGHLERFNAAVQAVQPILTVPRFIESARLAPFKHRGTDVDVVLDLMIHDIDLILSIVRSPVIAVDAIGSSVFSKEIDIANARLRFANGCVANATASRVSLKTERRLRLFQDDAYVSVDLHQKVLTVIRKGVGVGTDGMPQVAIEENTYEQGDALKAEIEAFLEAAATGSTPPVTGEDGLLALRTAVSIAEQVESSMAKFSYGAAAEGAGDAAEEGAGGGGGAGSVAPGRTSGAA
jgi:predicted dehydrogenase